MAFRPRLFSIPSERALWRYFEKNARYLENEQIYTIAGIYSDDTATLYKKLIDAWKEDREFHKEEIIAETMSSLGEEHISVQDIIGKKLNPDGFGYE
jgi:hypothetical protein